MSYYYDIMLKYIIIGRYSTGKTSIIKRFVTSKFEETVQNTVGMQFQCKTVEINNKLIKIMLWDTAGTESYLSVVRSYYRNCIVAIVVYDVTCRNSFEKVGLWMREVRENCNKFVRIAVVGNKIDVKGKREVSTQEGRQLAEQQKAMFFEVSAATGENVDTLLINSARKVLTDLDQNRIKLEKNTDIGIKYSNYKQSFAQNSVVMTNQPKRGCC